MESLQEFIGFLGRPFGPPRLFLLAAAWILALGVWGMVARNYLQRRPDARKPPRPARFHCARHV